MNKKIISGDIVHSIGSYYDRIRVLLGKAFRYDGQFVQKINSKVDVYNEFVLEERDILAETPSLVSPDIGSLEDRFPGTGGEPLDLAGNQQQSEVFDLGGTTTTETNLFFAPFIKEELQSFSGNDFFNVAGFVREEIGRYSPESTGESAPIIPELFSPSETNAVDENVLSGSVFGGLGGSPPVGTGVFPERTFPMEIGDIGGGSLETRDPYDFGKEIWDIDDSFLRLPQKLEPFFSEDIIFRPRLSVYNTEEDGEWSVFLCKLRIPELMERLASEGISNKEFITKISEYEDFHAFYLYLMGIKNAIEKEVENKNLYCDFIFNFDIARGESPYVIDYDINSNYNFYNKAFEDKNKALSDEKNIDNFYKNVILGRNVRGGTPTNTIFFANDVGEIERLNEAFLKSKNFPYGVSIETDVSFSATNSSLNRWRLLKQYMYSLLSTDYTDVPEKIKKDVYVVGGKKDIKFASDTFLLASWLLGVSTVRSRMFRDVEVDAMAVDLISSAASDVGIDPLVAAVSAKEVLKDFRKRKEYRDLVSCLSLDDGFFEHSCSIIEKLADVLKQRFCILFGGEEGGRVGIFDSQCFYSKEYEYNFSVLHNVFSTEYFYEANQERELFNINDLSVNFIIKTRKSVRTVNVPLFSDGISVMDAPPVPPNVSLVQYRDCVESGVASVLFLLNSAFGEEESVFVPLSNDDVRYIRNKFGSKYINKKILFRGDDPPESFEVFRIDFEPNLISDFSSGVFSVVSNTLKEGSTLINVSSNSFSDVIEFNKDYYYIFRQKDVHGFLSNPTQIFKVKALKFGDRYRVISKITSLEEILKEKRKKYTNFKTMRKFVCIKLNNKIIEKSGSFKKNYRLKVISKKTGKVVNVNFTVRMSDNPDFDKNF